MSCSVFSSNINTRTSLFDLGGCFLLEASGNGFSEVLFSPGLYKIELWGASGGSSIYSKHNIGGRGGYVSGVITIERQTKFYFYIGTAGTDNILGTPGVGGFNGGVSGASDPIDDNCPTGGSGGSTDMRLSINESYDNLSLLSRIMVAGGGGSPGCYSYGRGGDSGGIHGISGSSNDDGSLTGGFGGSQTTGFSLGNGGRGEYGNEAGGCGGGGYWGGFGGLSGHTIGGSGGGGGSSFISGHHGCISMNNDTPNSTQLSIHPSLYAFHDSVIISGNQNMPDSSNIELSESNGHSGSGAVRITIQAFISPKHSPCNPSYFPFIFLRLLQFFILLK